MNSFMWTGVASVIALSVISTARGTVITEFTTGEIASADGTYPVFIELDVRGQSEPFDVAIMLGRDGDELEIYRKYEINPQNYELVVIHEGAWPEEAANNILLYPVNTNDLGFHVNLTGTCAGNSKRLVVFDQVRSDWTENGTDPEPLGQWTHIDDMLGFAWGDYWSIQAEQSEPIIPIENDEAASRTVENTTDYLGWNAVGSVDADLVFPSDWILTPGRFNHENLQNAPEPSLSIMLLGSAAILLRRSRS